MLNEVIHTPPMEIYRTRMRHRQSDLPSCRVVGSSVFQTRWMTALLGGGASWHWARVIASFRAALGVDVRPFLTSPAFNAFMTQKVGENVDLIRSFPGRFRDGLKAKLEKELREAPFDQERLTKLLREEYKVWGTTCGESCGTRLKRPSVS